MTKTIKPFLKTGIAVCWMFIFASTIYAQTSIDSPTNGSTINATQYKRILETVTISGGVSPYTFVITDLPSGVELIPDDDDAGAVIEGVTTDTTDASVTLQVTDANEGANTTDTIIFTIAITPISTTTTIIINSPNTYELPEATVNEQYSEITFTTTDGQPDDYEWTISAGSIPDGMGLSQGDGILLGTPTESGEFNFTVTVTDNDDSNGAKLDGSRDYKLVVNGSSGSGDLQISSPTSANLPTGVLGNSYNVDVDATGGDGQYLFTQSGLPGGLSINGGTGVINGSPNSTGTFDVTITVTDGNGSGDSANRDYTLRILETGVAGYDSDPNPGSTLDFGNVNIGASFTIELIISEDGTGDLDVDEPSGGFIQGEDEDTFSITGNSPPFTIDDGDDDEVVSITCSPDASEDYNAILRFDTNDEDNENVVYSLICTGVVDGGNEDDETTTDDTGDDTTDGTVDDSTPTPSIPTQTPLPPTYSNVIEVEGLSIRTGPFIGASRRGVLRPNVNYRVEAKNNQEGVYMWYYIITDDGIEGWASGRYLAVYGQDVPFAGSGLDNVWNERNRGVIVEAIDNIHFRPGPSDRTQPYADLIPWAGRMTVYGRTTSGRGDEWYAVEYNGTRGWVYSGVVKVVEGLMEAIPKY